MLHHLFENIVTANREKVALIYREQKMTYEELNIRANSVAYKLKKNGVGVGSKVALMVERSFEMVIGILAILKVGGVYVPIDPEYPTDRIRYILSDSAPILMLTTKNAISYPLNYGIKSIDINDAFSYDSDEHFCNLNIEMPDDALAYIIYTSGSTGNPKGVMVEHRNVVSLLKSVDFGFTSEDVWTMFHSISFDFSVWELFGAITTGASLVLIPNEIRNNFREYRRLLIDYEVTIINHTPSAFYSLQIEEQKYIEKQLSSITHVIFGGEKLIPSKLCEWKKKYPHMRLFNMYGITETTVHVTCKELSYEDLLSGISNIGVALPHLKVHLLDEQCNCVKVNEIGEICVEGDGVARGYVNNPTETENHFIKCLGDSKKTLYKSGDLARYLPNGDMEYIGRIDNQVKIHGYRIELEEIETYILQISEINEAVVIIEDNDEYNISMKVLYSAEVDIDEKFFSNYLLTKIPSYMVPRKFKRVMRFIRKENGKIDRKKMSDLYKETFLDNSQLPVEEIPFIQAEILNVISYNLFGEVNKVSVDDDFIDVGIDSLSFIKVIVALEKSFSFQFDDEFLLITEFPTVRTLVEYVEKKII